MTVKSDYAISQTTSTQKPLQPIQSKYYQIFREQEALGNVRGYRPEQRIQANARYAEELKREVSQSFSYSSFFVRGDQQDDARFGDVFKRFFASARGGDHWVEKASKVLAGKFGGYSDVCHEYEVETERTTYRSGEYGCESNLVVRTEMHRGPTSGFIQELESLIKECYGLKETFLSILQANRLKLGDSIKLDHRDVSFATYLDKPQYPTLQEIEANNAIPRGQRQPLPRPQIKFFPKYYLLQALSAFYPKCTDKLNEIFTLLLEIKWLEHDNNQIKVYLGQGKNIPKGIGYGDNKGFIGVRGEVYAVKKTLGDGACGLHALLGEPVYGEYRYSGPQNVREVFVERLKEKIVDPVIRTCLISLIKSHLNATDDNSSRMIFQGNGETLKRDYARRAESLEGHRLRIEREEILFWLGQLNTPAIREKVFREVRKKFSSFLSDEEILDGARGNPRDLMKFVYDHRNAFLQRLDYGDARRISHLQEQKSLLLLQIDTLHDDFILTDIYPHYLEVVQKPNYLFNTEELELAAFLFEKKMQVFITDSGAIKEGSKLINEDLEGPLTIIHHANLHFQRCVPSTLEEEAEVEDALSEWNAALALAGLQKERDASIQKRFENLLKDEISTLAWSAAISAGTQNPAWVLGQSGRTAIKLWGNHIDPEQQRKDLQMLMLLANSSVAKGLGGNPSQLLMGLGIDLWDLGVRPENIQKNEASFRNMGISLVKGVLTLDYKKFAEGVLGGALSEGTNRLLETDEKTSTGARILLGLLKNQDAQGIMVGKTVDYAFKKPDPKTEIAHKDTGVEVEVDPDSESQFPPQEPTEEELRFQAEYETLKKEEQTKHDLELAEYERDLAEYERYETNKRLHETLIQYNQDKISHKETAVKEAEKTMLKYWDRYEKAKGIFSSGNKEFNKYWKKREIYKTLSGELNALKAQQGLPQEHPFKKFIKKPSPPKGILGALDDAYDKTCEIAKKIGLSGEANVITISSPEMNRARGEPTLFHHDLKSEPTRTQPSSPYWETRHQIAMQRAGLQSVDSKSEIPLQPKSNTVQNYGWQAVESMQQQQMFDKNMAHQSPINNSPQAPIDYQAVCGPGVSSNVQAPPTDFSGLGQEALALRPAPNRQIQMAGFAPSIGSEASAKVLQGVVSLFLPDMSDIPGAENPMDHINRIITAEAIDNFVKSIPKGTANILVAGACLMLPDMSDVPGAEDPRTHLKMVSKNAMLKYDQVMQIDPNAFSSKAGEFTGEMLAFGGAGKVIRVAEGVSVFGMACEGGMVGLVMAEAHDTNKVAGVAFGFAGGAAVGTFFSRTKPEMKALIDRMKAQPQGFGQQVRAIEALQPSYRSGFVTEGTVARLSERNVQVIKGGAYNRAQFEKYKTFLRAEMEKPHAVNPKLRELIEEIYRPNAQIGSGSTAAAIRYELETGEKVVGRFHSKKGEQMITALERWLKNNPESIHGDRAAAENIIKDIRNAFGE